MPSKFGGVAVEDQPQASGSKFGGVPVDQEQPSATHRFFSNALDTINSAVHALDPEQFKEGTVPAGWHTEGKTLGKRLKALALDLPIVAQVHQALGGDVAGAAGSLAPGVVTAGLAAIPEGTVGKAASTTARAAADAASNPTLRQAVGIVSPRAAHALGLADRLVQVVDKLRAGPQPQPVTGVPSPGGVNAPLRPPMGPPAPGPQPVRPPVGAITPKPNFTGPVQPPLVAKPVGSAIEPNPNFTGPVQPPMGQPAPPAAAPPPAPAEAPTAAAPEPPAPPKPNGASEQAKANNAQAKGERIARALYKFNQDFPQVRLSTSEVMNMSKADLAKMVRGLAQAGYLSASEKFPFNSIPHIFNELQKIQGPIQPQPGFSMGEMKNYNTPPGNVTPIR